MKKALAILSAVLLLLVSCQYTLVHVWFKANQDNLAATRCINRFEPQVMCYGTCVLNDLLSQIQEQEQKNQPIGAVEQPATFHYLPTEVANILTLPLVATVTPGFSYTDQTGRLLAIRFFQPPRQAA